MIKTKEIFGSLIVLFCLILSQPLLAKPASFRLGEGTTPVLFILVNFNDIKGSVPAEHFVQLRNQADQYFRFNSLDKFSLTAAAESFNTSDGVVGWVETGIDHSPWYTPMQIFLPAIRAADPFVDFSRFDRDNDKRIHSHELSIVLVFPGIDGRFQPSARYKNFPLSYNTPVTSLDGVTLGGDTDKAYYSFSTMFSILSEYQGNAGDTYATTVGILAHELGHNIFNMPDLYVRKTSQFSGLGGIEYYGLMGAGDWGRKLTVSGEERPGETPIMLGAYSRYKMGWLTAKELTGPASLIAASADNQQFPQGDDRLIKINTSHIGEYFLLEYRSNQGYDQGLQGIYGSAFDGGLLIWHVYDVAVTDNKYNILPASYHPPLVDVEQAEKTDTYLANQGVQLSDLFTVGSSFDALSIPSSHSYGYTGEPIPDSTAIPLQQEDSGITVKVNGINGDGLAVNIASNATAPTNEPPLPAEPPPSEPQCVPGQNNWKVQFNPEKPRVGQPFQIDVSQSLDQACLAFTKFYWNFGTWGEKVQHVFNRSGLISIGVRAYSETTKKYESKGWFIEVLP